MAKFIEKIGDCLNELSINPDDVQPNDKVILYKLKFQKLSRGEVLNSNWKKEIDSNDSLVILERDTSGMCRNENIRDAADDVCDILSEWQTRFLLEYNKGRLEKDQFNNFKSLMNNSGKKDVRSRIEMIAHTLGGVTVNEIYEMGFYKLSRNRRAHKGKFLSQNVAHMRLEVAGVGMNPVCKSAFEKCIGVINERS